MKFLERLALTIFSLIILVLAVVSCLVVFNCISLDNMCKYISDIIENETVARTIIIISAICIILAIKALFFPTRIKKREEIKSGVLLENKDGRLLISKDTIENLVISIVKSFKEAVDVQTKVYLDVNNNITVFISLLVKEDAIIKELSSNIQTKIKDTIKRNTGLEVNQININVKNIENIDEAKKINKTEAKPEVNNKDKSIEKIKEENIEIDSNQTKEDKVESEIV